MSNSRIFLLQSSPRMYHSLRAGSFQGRRSSVEKRLSQLVFPLPGTITSIGSRRQFTTEKVGKQRIALALYRQVLRWCDSTEDNFPLSYFVPPIYLKPPQIDEENLRLLATGDEKLPFSPSMFPPKTKIEENQMTCPIHSSDDIKSYAKGVFRLNAGPTSQKNQKERITSAFDGIKSLNELTAVLEKVKENRERHIDRDNVKFRVGEVVKHKTEEWRGVIMGWEKIVDQSKSEPEQPTSLTQKAYTRDLSDNVRYSLFLDSGDAHLHYSNRREFQNPSMAEVYQSDIELVEDKSLLRIRNTHAAAHFKRFDSTTNSFVPNEVIAYEFPNDLLDEFRQPPLLNEKSEQAAKDVIEGVQQMADHLRNVILGFTSAPESRGLKLLAFFLEKLNALSDGDVVPVKDRFSADLPTTQKLASMHLQKLLNLVVEIGELLWQKRMSAECERPIKFALGDVVRHKEYDFRGVVVAWDPEPSIDVSRWDGLQHIKDPHQFPFYHIIPDQNDCIQAFGGERHSKYVCEENLEICHRDSRDIDVDLAPEWDFDSADGVYIPPDDLKFKYCEWLEDDAVTERCLTEIQDSLSRMFISSRDAISAGEPELDAVSKKLSMNNLLDILKTADDLDTATVISDSLKEIWKAHVNSNLRWKLATATSHLLGGNTNRALSCFSELVDEDPSYAEAWNKASTCEFMLGNMEASLAAARKTLECLPTHFQAQNGLGLVYYEKKDLPSAVECFHKSMDLDPWSPVSSRLSVCLDTLKLWNSTSGNKPNES